ncbi:MAG: MFS transporter [Bacteroidota bacterium]
MDYLRLLRQYPRYIAYGFVHYFFSSAGQTFFISLFVPFWLLSLEIDNLEFGSIYSGATLLSAFSLPWLGQWLDRLKLRYFSMGVGIVFVLFCIAMAYMANPVWLFFSLFGLRLCGQGLLILTGSTAIARYFEEDRGKALSLIGFGVSIGEFVLPLLIVSLLAWVSWQLSWWIIAATIALIFLPAAFFLIPIDDSFQNPMVDSPSEDQSNQQQQFSRKQVLTQPTFYLILLLLLFLPFFYTGMVIHKNLIGLANGWSEQILAQALSLFGLTRLLANLFVGPLIDRISGVKVFPYILAPIIICCVGFLLTDHIAVLYLFFLMTGLCSSLVSIAGTAILPELYGTVHLGAIKSMVSTFAVLASAAAPIILGWALSDPADHIWVWGISAGLVSILTILAVVFVGKLGKNA